MSNAPALDNLDLRVPPMLWVFWTDGLHPTCILEEDGRGGETPVYSTLCGQTLRPGQDGTGPCLLGRSSKYKTAYDCADCVGIAESDLGMALPPMPEGETYYLDGNYVKVADLIAIWQKKKG